MSRWPIYITAILILLCQTQAEDTDVKLRSRYGGYIGLNYNMYSADFSELPGVPSCCPAFEFGTGLSVLLGGLYEWPIQYPYMITLNAGFNTISGAMKTVEQTTIIKNKELQPGEFEHLLEASAAYLYAQPGLAYYLTPVISVRGGLSIGIPVYSSYSQKEKIVLPKYGGTFIDEEGKDTGKRTRNESTGDISNMSFFMLGIDLSVAAELPLNRDHTMLLSPMAGICLSPTNLVNGRQWTSSALWAAIAIKYQPLLPEDIEVEYDYHEYIDTTHLESPIFLDGSVVEGVPEFERDTLQQNYKMFVTEDMYRTDTLYHHKIFDMQMSVETVAIDSMGNEDKLNQIKAEEFNYTKFQPLLNYIFFDEGSDAIPERYQKLNKRTASGFDQETLYNLDGLDLYYHILNIIGFRLNQYPEAIITITGCNSAQGIEKHTSGLSQRRAEAVKKYFVDTWQISESRIKTKARNLPFRPSLPSDQPMKIAENMRAEISSDLDAILKPVFVYDTIKTMYPAKLRFEVSASSEAGVRGWNLVLKQGKRPIASYNSREYSNGIIEISPDKLQSGIDTDKPISYTLHADDNYGASHSTMPQQLDINYLSLERKIREGITDKIYERYSLILFDFNKSRLTESNQQIVNLITDRIKTTSRVEVIGYADATGNEKHNQELSEKRAIATAKALGITNANAYGIGETTLLFDNSLPEGRFYCRTVRVIVETTFDR